MHGGLIMARKPSSIRLIGSDATNRCCLTEKISSKQLMQQSRKSHLFPFTATRCNMLREVWGRSDVRRWVPFELGMQNKALITTEPRVTSSHSDI